MKFKKLIFILLGLSLLMVGCKTQEVPGRQRAPRHCNSCTKWTYMPQSTVDPTDFVSHEA